MVSKTAYRFPMQDELNRKHQPHFYLKSLKLKEKFRIIN